MCTCTLQVNPAEAKQALWTQCRLSGERLRPPCCSDELGSLFNKDSVVTALVTKVLNTGLLCTFLIHTD